MSLLRNCYLLLLTYGWLCVNLLSFHVLGLKFCLLLDSIESVFSLQEGMFRCRGYCSAASPKYSQEPFGCSLDISPFFALAVYHRPTLVVGVTFLSFCNEHRNTSTISLHLLLQALSGDEEGINSPTSILGSIVEEEIIESYSQTLLAFSVHIYIFQLTIYFICFLDIISNVKGLL